MVGVSQSGQSPDIVSVLEEGRRQGCLTLAITNVPDFAAGQAADFVLDIQAGVEKAVAATKTYTAELMAIAMLSAALDGDGAAWQELAAGARWMARRLSWMTHIAAHGAALPLYEPMRGDRARLQLRHRLRVVAEAQGIDLRGG